MAVKLGARADSVSRGTLNELRRFAEGDRAHAVQKEVTVYKIWKSTYVYFHLSVEAVVQNEVVRHSDAMRFHRVSWSIVVVADLILKRNTQNRQRVRRSQTGRARRAGTG